MRSVPWTRTGVGVTKGVAVGVGAEVGVWMFASVGVEAGVEPAQAAESACQGDVGDGQRAFVEQVFGEMQATGQGNGQGCGSDVTKEQPMQVPRPDANTFGEFLHGVLVQNALLDQLQRARDRG